MAAEAARIIAEQDLPDFVGARRKAASRLGVTDRRQWPDDGEIAEALSSYRGLFQEEDHRNTLSALRHVALSAMDTLAEFRPRLIGGVRDGTAGRHSPIRLLLFADSAKDVVIGLLDRGMQVDSDDIRLRFAGGSMEVRPTVRFALDDVLVEAVILAPKDRSRPPLDRISGRADAGIGVEGLRFLLSDHERSAEGM
jgi:hypothetical protein